MNIGSILKKVGGGIIKQVFPAAGAIVDIVNELLPGDERLSEDATGDQIQTAINSLPSDQQAQIMSKQIDLKTTEIKEWSKVVGSLAEADATGSTTRPWIAKIMAIAIFATVIGYIIGYLFAICSSDDKTLEMIADSWEVMLAVLATPTALLRAYFGLRTEEKKARYASATGQEHISGLLGTMKTFFKK